MNVARVAMVCAGLWVHASCVHAQPTPPPRAPATTPTTPTPVTFDLPRCEPLPYDEAELLARLRLELSVRGLRPILDRRATPEPPRLHVELALPACQPDAAELTLTALPNPRPLARESLTLTEIPIEARPLALALIIAESLSLAPQPATPPSTATPAAASAPSTPPSLQLSFAAQHRTPLLASHPFWGGALSASRSTPWLDPVSWVAEVGFATNGTDTRLGHMQTDWWSLGLGLDLRERGLLELAVGPRLGLAYVSARPELTSGASDSSTQAFMVLWGAGAELALPLGSCWVLRATLALEQPFRGLVLTAGGERSLSLEGWLLTSGLGLGFRS